MSIIRREMRQERKIHAMNFYHLQSKNLPFIGRAALLCLSLIGSPVRAASTEDCGPNQQRCIAVGTWEFKLGLGLGARSNPVINGDEIPLILIPQVSYYGKRFFFDTTDLGYTLVDRKDLMLNLLVTPGREGLYFFRDGWRSFFLDGGLNVGGNSFAPVLDRPDDNSQSPPGDGGELGPQPTENPDLGPNPGIGQEAEPFKNLHRRHTAAMAGLEVSSQLGALEWQLQLLTDVSGVHNGEELRLAISGAQNYGGHQLGLATGFSWKSADLLEYYYGVSADEASQALPAYTPSSGATPFVRLSWSKPLNRNWHWLGSLQYDHLSRAQRHSPLITNNQVVQIFVGGVYHF